MRRRIFLYILLTALIILAVTVSVVTLTVYNEFVEERRDEIRTELTYVAEGYSTAGTEYLRQIGTQSKNRITLISPTGDVMYDNFADASAMKNHLDRPEIADAIKSGSGESERQSDTLSEKTFYIAIRLSDGNVLRVAATVKSLTKIIDNTATYIALTAVAAVIIVLVAAQLLTRRIVRPLNDIDLDSPLERYTYEELTPLMLRMDMQNKQIAAQMEQLSAKQREFNEITDEMSDAMVIFGSDKKAVSMNRSARRLFSYYSDNLPSYIELCRDEAFIRAAEQTFSGHSASEKLKLNGRIYRLNADPVSHGGDYAAVLVAEDITLSELDEQMRKEFSANVSHELKTPLTSIIGCAEIMTNGVAKAEDYPRFTNQILSEARRLLTLIEDIIRLSRLDENDIRHDFAPVELYPLCEKVTAQMHDKAQSLGVELKLSGENLTVSGDESALHEMIFNLCDNAVSYNRRGGTASIAVYNEKGHTCVSVSDTGIGIAAEHRDRIFERFYRVDKSHSKEHGGTGLGLSIVKHIALLHNAQITLDSTPGIGSRITIIFP